MWSSHIAPSWFCYLLAGNRHRNHSVYKSPPVSQTVTVNNAALPLPRSQTRAETLAPCPWLRSAQNMPADSPATWLMGSKLLRASTLMRLFAWRDPQQRQMGSINREQCWGWLTVPTVLRQIGEVKAVSTYMAPSHLVFWNITGCWGWYSSRKCTVYTSVPKAWADEYNVECKQTLEVFAVCSSSRGPVSITTACKLLNHCTISSYSCIACSLLVVLKWKGRLNASQKMMKVPI